MKRKEYRNFSIQQLSPGVWAAIHNDAGGHAICNAGIIDLGNQAVVFDCFINPDAAMELKSAATALTGKQVGYLISSHYHDDHIRGNQAFKPGTLIISSAKTHELIEKTEPDEQSYTKKHIAERLEAARQRLAVAAGSQKEEESMWLAYFEAIHQSLPGLKTTLPDITFTDSLVNTWEQKKYRTS